MNKGNICGWKVYGKINLRGKTLKGKTKPDKSLAIKLNKIAELSGENPDMEFKLLIPQ